MRSNKKPFRPVRSLFLAIAFFPVALGSLDAYEARSPKMADRFQGPLREPPDRVADAIHLALTVSFNWQEKAVTGQVSHTFRSLRQDLKKITLDAVNIDVGQVVDDQGRKLDHESYEDRLVIYLAEPLQRNEEFHFTIDYRCRPSRGIYFRELKGKAGNASKQVWSQGETHEARHWIPCFDHPVERLTTEVKVFAPQDLVAVSNGKLVGVQPAPENGGRLFHWKQDKPHTTYLIAVVVGQFAEYKDDWDGIPLVAYVPVDRLGDAERSFGLTGDMMEYFSKTLRTRYPWDKYAQLCVEDFLFGGMENTSATILTDNTLHDEKAALNVSSVQLVAHELAHQWFGDFVTCKDWAHIWINESFATFLANEYWGHHFGWDEEVYGRKQQMDRYFEEDRERYRRALATRNYREPGYMFDSHSYPKGALILAMLMVVLGEETFYNGLGDFLKKHAFQSVESEDFRISMETSSGRSLLWFFDQWIYSGGHPEYNVAYSWEEESQLLRLTVKQEQELDQVTKLFRMPVEIEVTTPAGKSLHRIEVSKKEETFSFGCAQRPQLVSFDKENWILKELTFSKSREELSYQLENDPNVLGRIHAAKDLASRAADSKAQEVLLRRLVEEPFWGVRLEIADALKNVPGDTVRSGLIGSFKQEKNAKVRQRIAQTLSEFSGEETTELMLGAIENDPSYYVVAEALRTLGELKEKRAFSQITGALERPSHLDVIRAAAMESLGTLHEEGVLETEEENDVVETLTQYAAPSHRTPTRLAAIGVLGDIGKGKEPVYQLLVDAVDDPVLRIRMAVFEALGKLGDDRAVAVLKARRGKEGHRVFRDPLEAIDNAIRDIEGDEQSDLSGEIDKLRRAQEELQKRLDILEKRG